MPDRPGGRWFGVCEITLEDSHPRGASWMSMNCTLYAASPDAVRQCASVPEDFIPRLGGRESGVRSLALGKTWHGLHFTLTGKAAEGKQPLSFLVAGGKPIVAEGDEEDEAFIPPRVLPPAFVAKLAKSLAAITPGEFGNRFDPARMAEAAIYPRIWDEPPAELLRDYQAACESLRQFVSESAERGDMIVVELTS